jgi:hypothetical protein
MREDPGVHRGRHDQVVHGGAAAVQLPQRPSECVSDSDLSPPAPLDRDGGDGVLIQPARFSPFRHDDRSSSIDPIALSACLILLSVAPPHFLGAASKLDEPVFGNGEPPSARRRPHRQTTPPDAPPPRTPRGPATNHIGIEDQRRARPRAPVGTADGGAGHGSVSVDRQLCCRSRCTPARSAHQRHTAVSATSPPDHGSDHHADRRRQQGPRRAPRAA